MSDVGRVRSGNEDSFVVDAIDKPGGQVVLLAVCDGMGGHAAGEVASRATTEVLSSHLRRAPFSADPDEAASELVAAVRVADRLLFEAGSRDRALLGMGTTLTAAAIVDGRVLIAEVGDSRAYVFREGVLVQLTRDQTLVEQLVEAGQLRREDVADFAYGNVILQAVGTTGDVQVDLTVLGACRGDLLLLCSDGLHGAVGEDALREVLEGEGTPSEKCRVLVERANGAGGEDNITCVLAALDDARLPPPEGRVARYEKYVWPITPAPPVEAEDSIETAAPSLAPTPRSQRTTLALLVLAVVLLSVVVRRPW
jgi:protein phosphatase